MALGLFTCSRCATAKPRAAFGSRVQDGRRYRTAYCRPCQAEISKARQRAATPAQRRAVYRKAREAICADPRRELLYAARSRASLRNLPFALRLEDIVIPAVCPVFGVPLRKAAGRRGPDSPSLDRIDPAKGYVPGNVRVLSWRANELRRNGTLDEFRALVRFLEAA